MELSNKIIVITGASKGLGRETAMRLARQASDVILVARTESLLLQVQEQIRATIGKTPFVIQCDISLESDVDRMASTIKQNYSRIDILVNNAGFGIYQPSEHISNQEMRRHFEVNFFGTYYCIKALLPLLKESEAGYVLNVGSLFSRVALAENSVYAATKFALSGFTEGLRHELRPLGVRVGLLLLGAMATSFQDNRREGAIRSPMALDPRKVARVAEAMICRQKKTVTLPAWMLTALKLKYSFT